MSFKAITIMAFKQGKGPSSPIHAASQTSFLNIAE